MRKNGSRLLSILLAAAWLPRAVADEAPPVRSPLPADARHVIDLVHAAAATRDEDRLRRVMTPRFKVGFGPDGDTDPDHALAAWRADPRMFEALARVTADACEAITDTFVACPANAGPELRAGFERESGRWRMSSFLGGD